jgi:ATP-dependent Clp protease adaptor protein ClpS
MSDTHFPVHRASGSKRDDPNQAPGRGTTALLERQESKTRPPPLFQVLLLNDDFTPMEFVVVVLQKFFLMDLERATQVMLKVHREGRGVCGVFTRDIAATKVELVSSFARMHQHPLQCVMEEA